jgi:cytoskeletal protein RodZ
MRRGVDFAQAELAIKIRGKYLRALEDEQFDVLPAETYVKGFLRTYAEYLGLDGQLYVDEFNSRFVAGEQHEARSGRPRRSTARPQRRTRGTETMVVLIALAAIGVLTVIVISAWTTSDKPRASTPPPKHVSTTAHVTPPLLALTARRGASHVIVHTGSATGAIRYEGTVQTGDNTVAIRGKRLWVALDSPENLRIEIRGKRVSVPGSRPRVIIVSATGWRPA